MDARHSFRCMYTLLLGILVGNCALNWSCLPSGAVSSRSRLACINGCCHSVGLDSLLTRILVMLLATPTDWYALIPLPKIRIGVTSDLEIDLHGVCRGRATDGKMKIAMMISMDQGPLPMRSVLRVRALRIGDARLDKGKAANQRAASEVPGMPVRRHKLNIPDPCCLPLTAIRILPTAAATRTFSFYR